MINQWIVVNIEAEDLGLSFFDDQPHGFRGSGFVIGDKGLIITNPHVVQKFNNVKVIYKNEIFESEIVDRSPFMDLAMIKVNEDLPKAELGDSTAIRIGQRVYLIGNSFGLRGNPTVGSCIISGIKRSVRVGSLFLLDLVQTDAHLNAGNSGGPLIDVDGKVLGVTTATISYGEGIGFSIPINIVKDYMNQVMTKGRYTIPSIGVDGITVTPNLNRIYSLGSDYVVLLMNIFKGSTAERAGLDKTSFLSKFVSEEFPPKKLGIIVSLDGHKIEGFEELLRIIRSSEIGKRVKVGLIKNGKKSEVEVEIGERW